MESTEDIKRNVARLALLPVVLSHISVALFESRPALSVEISGEEFLFDGRTRNDGADAFLRGAIASLSPAQQEELVAALQELAATVLPDASAYPKTAEWLAVVTRNQEEMLLAFELLALAA